MKLSVLLAVMLMVVCLVSSALPAAACGDRFPAADVDLRFPAECFLHNGRGGHVIDVTNLPDYISDHDAHADGTRADETTDALLDLCDWLLRQFKRAGSLSFRGHTSAYIVYFPNGTYAVNDTIVHRGSPWLRDNGHEDLSQLRFYGRSRAGVSVRLVDNAAAFQDKANPKAVIAFTKHTHNNSISTNILQDMTVNGGAAEVLGGIVNQYRSGDGRLNHNPAFELIDADGSFIASTSSPTDREFKTILRETQGSVTKTLQNTEFPIREENKIHIPLVVGTGRTP